MNGSNPEKRNVTPAQALKILKDHGVECDEKDVIIILDFLYKLAKLAVNQQFNKK